MSCLPWQFMVRRCRRFFGNSNASLFSSIFMISLTSFFFLRSFSMLMQFASSSKARSFLSMWARRLLFACGSSGSGSSVCGVAGNISAMMSLMPSSLSSPFSSGMPSWSSRFSSGMAVSASCGRRSHSDKSSSASKSAPRTGGTDGVVGETSVPDTETGGVLGTAPTGVLGAGAGEPP